MRDDIVHCACKYIFQFVFSSEKTIKQIYTTISKDFSCRNLNWSIENSYLTNWNKFVIIIYLKHAENQLSTQEDVVFEGTYSNN